MVALFAVIGCASPRAPTYIVLPAPPSEEVRAHLGAIRVVMGDSPATTEITQPMGKGHAAGHGGWVGFWAAPAYGAAAGDAYGAVAGLFLSPVTGTAGAIYGAVAGMSKHEYEQVCATLQTALREVGVPGRLVATVTDSTGSSFPVAAASAQALLELTPAVICLRGPIEIEPPLTFVYAVRVRLLSAAERMELYATEFSYTGSRHALRTIMPDFAAVVSGATIILAVTTGAHQVLGG